MTAPSVVSGSVAAGGFDPSAVRPRAMRDAFLEQVYQAMGNDPSIYFVCADFGSPVLDKIRAEFSGRFINVGIAEQNLINVTSGLAAEGFTVFAYAIAPFITMRCFEQIRVNLALLSEVRPLNVTLIGVGAGYSYVVSGPTHQCYEDLSLMRCLPNVAIYSPADHVAAAAVFPACCGQPGIKYLRLDAQVLPVIYPPAEAIAEGATPLSVDKGFHLHQAPSAGSLCLLATGYMLHTAQKVAQTLSSDGVPVAVIDLFDLCRFDHDALAAELAGCRGLVTMEEGFRGRGGVDAMMFDFIARRRLALPMFNVGVTPGYRFELGKRQELHEQVGIGEQAVLADLRSFWSSLIG